MTGEIIRFHSVKHGSASAFMEVGGRHPQWLSIKESACNSGDTRDLSLIPGSGRSLGEGDSNPPQYSCLGNPMDCLVGYSSWDGEELHTTENSTQCSTAAPTEFKFYVEKLVNC